MFEVYHVPNSMFFNCTVDVFLKFCIYELVVQYIHYRYRNFLIKIRNIMSSIYNLQILFSLQTKIGHFSCRNYGVNLHHA